MTAVVDARAGVRPKPKLDFDSLTVAEIVPKLPSLPDDLLTKLRVYETRHKARVTLLRAIDKVVAQRAVAATQSISTVDDLLRQAEPPSPPRPVEIVHTDKTPVIGSPSAAVAHAWTLEPRP